MFLSTHLSIYKNKIKLDFICAERVGPALGWEPFIRIAIKIQTLRRGWDSPGYSPWRQAGWPGEPAWTENSLSLAKKFSGELSTVLEIKIRLFF